MNVDIQYQPSYSPAIVTLDAGGVFVQQKKEKIKVYYQPNKLAHFQATLAGFNPVPIAWVCAGNNLQAH